METPELSAEFFTVEGTTNKSESIVEESEGSQDQSDEASVETSAFNPQESIEVREGVETLELIPSTMHFEKSVAQTEASSTKDLYAHSNEKDASDLPSVISVETVSLESTIAPGEKENSRAETCSSMTLSTEAELENTFEGPDVYIIWNKECNYADD